MKIFNTLKNKKEKFKPINSNIVNVYVCGITPYDLCHIGHARTLVFFDIMIKYFQYKGYRTNYIRNITDIDDKIINKAFHKKEKYNLLSDFMIKEMKYDLNSLNIMPPNNEPRVTNHISDILEMIKILLEKKHAYISKTGDVVFDISTYRDYGKLSKRFEEKKQLLNNKKNKINFKTKKEKDFVLWKMSKPNEPSWKSPWGHGRPGWHIECSAISDKTLGNIFDIHGGGSDLIFPHHENEIAQSKCANSKFNVNFWVHTGMVMFKKEKMSKSLGNSCLIREIVKKYDADTLKYFLTSSHYRSQITYSVDNMEKSKSAVKRLYRSLHNTNYFYNLPIKEKFTSKFIDAMNDDFNTPKAYSVLFSISRQINYFKNKNPEKANQLSTVLKNLSNIIGILNENPDSYLNNKLKFSKDKINKIKSIIKKRENYRKLKQWEKADEERKKLKYIGVCLEDTIQGTKWFKL